MNARLARAAPRSAHPLEARSAPDARAALASWLLGPHVQIGAGIHAGAAAGWIDGSGSALYVYPEITGYYLQWLAWRAACRGANDELRQRAAAAQRWLDSWARADAPQTRVYLRRSEPDWRNEALFFFDLAMVIRGLANAARTGLIEADTALIDRVSELLLRLVATDGQFDACVRTRPDADIPARWSTRRGPFLSKAAAGVLTAVAQFPAMPRALERAAEASFRTSIESMADAPHADTHARLYAIEGALCRLDHQSVVRTLPAIEGQLRDIIRSSKASGQIPESRNGGLVRLDIVAQTIRAAALLPERTPRNDVEPMMRMLVGCVDPELGILFSPSERPGQYNAWTAMFAEQALGAADATAIERTADARRFLV
jgi:hypothetical protein